jgi:hypothetical protein
MVSFGLLRRVALVRTQKTPFFIAQYLFRLLLNKPCNVTNVGKQALVETYHEPPGSEDLLARDGVDDGEVALCADHDQNED